MGVNFQFSGMKMLRIYFGLFLLVLFGTSNILSGSLYFPDDCPEDDPCPPERPYCCVGGRCVHTPHDCGDGECLSDSDCPDPHFPCCSPYGYCHQELEYCSGSTKWTPYTTISTSKTSSTKSTLLTTTTTTTMTSTTTNHDIDYCHHDMDCPALDECCSMFGHCGSEYCIPPTQGY